MQKKISLLIICMMLATTFSGIFYVKMSVADPTTIYVDDNNTVGPWDGTIEHPYQHIQDAINSAINGDTVFVYNNSSPYIENIIVNKSIALNGENKNTTIIDGNKSGDVFHVTADGVSIRGFTILNGRYHNDIHSGVDIHSNDTTISNNIIKNNFDGILISSTNINNISFDKYQIFGNIIVDNIISSNTGWGIELYDTNENTITNNIIINNSYSGIHANGACNNLISGNEISKNDNAITLFDFNVLVKNNHGSNNNTICGNNFTNNRLRGIELIDSMNNNISQNNFMGNRLSIAKFAFYIKISGNNKWDGNYWGNPRQSPFIIFGKISISYEIYGWGIIPWFNFDWHPAQEPYNIS